MSDESSSDQEDPESTSSKTGREMFEDLSRALADALQHGTSDAKRIIEDKLPQWKSDMAQGLYKAAYAAAYATAFGTAIARELVPDTVADGFREGAQAGKRDADEAMQRRAEKKAEEGASAEISSPESGWI